MKHDDFAIGQEFGADTGRWRRTDVGTRTVIAIKVSAYDDPSWFNGPPYAALEIVLDEDDLESCWRIQPPEA